MSIQSLNISATILTFFILVILPNSLVEAQRVLQSTFGNKRTYEFGYTVDKPEFKNDFGHYESKRLDGVVRGQYHVLLPDGRVQLVVYYADESGYHPTITYLSLNDWNLIKSGRLSLPLLRTRLRQNIPLNSLNSRNPPIRTLDPSSNKNKGLSNRRPNNPRTRNSLPSQSTSSPFGTTSASRFSANIRGRVTTNNPSTRFPTRTPFSNRVSTTSSTIRPNLVNSRRRFPTSPSRLNERSNRFTPSTVLPSRNSQTNSPFVSNRGSFQQNGDDNDLLFNGRGNSRFRPSTTRPFRRNVAIQIRNNPSSNKSPFYFDNTL